MALLLATPFKPELMRRLTLLILLVTTTLAATAQQKDTSIYSKYTAIKWATHSIIWPGHFIQLGVERRFGKYALQAQGGVSIPWAYSVEDSMNNPPGSLTGNYKGYTVRLEGRRYAKPFKTRKASNFFMAFEMFYTCYNQIRSAFYTDEERDLESYLDEYLVSKSMFSLTTLKGGVQHRFGKHFLLEWYVGLGVKIKTVTQQGRNDITHIGSKRDFNFSGPYLGTHATLSAPVNLSIGYRF